MNKKQKPTTKSKLEILFISFRGWRKKKWLRSNCIAFEKKKCVLKNSPAESGIYRMYTEHMHDERLLKMRQMEETAKKEKKRHTLRSVFFPSHHLCVCVYEKSYPIPWSGYLFLRIESKWSNKNSTVPCLSADFQCLDHNSCTLIRLERKTYRKNDINTAQDSGWFPTSCVFFASFHRSIFTHKKYLP